MQVTCHMLTYIQPFDDIDSFPALEHAQQEPNGLLAIGGDLSPERLLQAYRSGIFPWFNDDQPILWWSPDPRMILIPQEFHCSRSLGKATRKAGLSVSIDQAFSQVIQQCSAPRSYADSTWITDSMLAAYHHLHQLGYAHSVEIWQDEKLVGGLYGLAIGKMFFGESMFSLQSNASKIAFKALSDFLQRNGFPLIDCQVYSEHLQSMGAREVSRKDFFQQVQALVNSPSHTNWNVKAVSLRTFID